MKIQLLILPFFLIFVLSCNKENEANADDFSVVTIDEPLYSKEAKYIDGCVEGFASALLEEINYPAEAREQGIEGTVVAEFEITEVGTTQNHVITEDIDFNFGDIVLNSLLTATQDVSFYPAEIDNVPVLSTQSVSIKFKIE